VLETSGALRMKNGMRPALLCLQATREDEQGYQARENRLKGAPDLEENSTKDEQDERR
jgi:hypothetical protein